MFTPVKGTKIYEQVVEQIKKMIGDGTLKRGDKLPTERDLAEQLQVSRPSVREALRALEVIGLIESRQGAGNYIRESFEESLLEPLSMMFMLQESSPFEIIELREILELETVVLAAERITESELAVLRNLLEDMKECENEERNVQLDRKFHYTIARASRNLLILNVVQVISQLIDSLIENARRKILSGESRAKLTVQHELIYKALSERDRDSAYEAIKDHFRLIKQYYRNEF
ncbi:MAG: FadR/GntR family transcriptional regulator [Bacillota bacterium]|nr:FadR/GntR family transcriptional regulator [Bacillota bacterium]